MKSTYKNTLPIILVDKDKDYQFLFGRALEATSFNTSLTTMNDGEHLTEFLLKSPGNIPYIIFFDLNMLNKNGFDLLSDNNKNERFHSLPIIVLTDSVPSDKSYDIFKLKKILHNKASDFIRKPIDYSELKLVIQTCLTKIFESNSVNYTTYL